ncbi:MAG TPA: lysophospholipid acyltransferase family protein, partial [Rhodocyclaceae bacterium]|nr:lysophospholipid acyltransferase family protein [Rhodocyclaceae bacterium]
MIRFFSLFLAALLWLLHFLPYPLLAWLGERLGDILHTLASKRRQVALVNLQLCFPEMTTSERSALVHAHFRLLGRSLLERTIFWWSDPDRIRRLVLVAGEEKVRALLASGQPVILLAPHFLGLDAGGVAVTMRFDIVSLYAAQSNPVFNRLLLRGRSRFGDQLLLSRQEGVRATIKAMKSGRPFYYLPDINVERREAVFVPFFGTPAATVTALPRIAKAAEALVLPCVTRMLPGRQGYQVEIGEPWPDYP